MDKGCGSKDTGDADDTCDYGKTNYEPISIILIFIFIIGLDFVLVIERVHTVVKEIRKYAGYCDNIKDKEANK